MLKKIALRILGCVFLALMLIGLMLPVVPQVPFLLAAAWCFGVRRETIEGWIEKGKALWQRALKRLRNIDG